MADTVGFMGLGSWANRWRRTSSRQATTSSRTTTPARRPKNSTAPRSRTPRERSRSSRTSSSPCSRTRPGRRGARRGERGARGHQGRRPDRGHGTISPSSPRSLRRRPEEGASMLDAPVSGGDVGAIDGTLSIMVGGSEEDFGRAVPLFEVMGGTVTHVGPVGTGRSSRRPTRSWWRSPSRPSRRRSCSAPRAGSRRRRSSMCSRGARW